jgi:succinate-acetate transporter protein
MADTQADSVHAPANTPHSKATIDAPYPMESPPSPDTPDIRIGAGGEPLGLGASVFLVGALTFGMAFTGVFPAGATGVGVPVAIFASGLGLFLTALWGLFRGETILSAIFGTVAGLFVSFGVLLMGLYHNWFAIPAASVPSAEAIFFIAYACWFALLLVPSVKLPLLYTIALTVVVVSLALAAIGELAGKPGLLQTAGAGFLVISFLLALLLTNVNTTAVGMKPWPPLGKPLVE